MVGASHSVPVAPTSPTFLASPVVPSPRRTTEDGGSVWERARRWYENALGWPTAPGEPVRLRTGVRFDVLDVPAEAGYATLQRLGRAGGLGACAPVPGFPVAVRDERMLLLVAAGGAEELPGLLEWLDWGSLPLGLTAVGAGGLVDAPLAPGPGPRDSGPDGPNGAESTNGTDGTDGFGVGGLPPRPPDRDGLRGAAVWLRPPEPECEVESSLPALSALGGAGTPLDLARLVRTLATQCHRVRLTAGAPPRARPVARVG
ncbi:SCO3374 family protein [Streptomyces coelicoflavus]|uniref:SCO3374 family protein n=1 Tax=Streptomyces coelicoflavus TaxID=285562 RepID=UPI0024AD3A94|nr:SCO3374 family protein [Streptomyces coelicoflavus]MDI6521249.1 SCO3374 family protein [Streptomyces coelicoflavus]